MIYLGEIVGVYLTNDELKKLKILCDFYGNESRSRIIKLALGKFYDSWSQKDVVEKGPNADLERIKRKEG